MLYPICLGFVARCAVSLGGVLWCKASNRVWSGRTFSLIFVPQPPTACWHFMHVPHWWRVMARGWGWGRGHCTRLVVPLGRSLHGWEGQGALPVRLPLVSSGCLHHVCGSMLSLQPGPRLELLGLGRGHRLGGGGPGRAQRMGPGISGRIVWHI